MCVGGFWRREGVRMWDREGGGRVVWRNRRAIIFGGGTAKVFAVIYLICAFMVDLVEEYFVRINGSVWKRVRLYRLLAPL